MEPTKMPTKVIKTENQRANKIILMVYPFLVIGPAGIIFVEVQPAGLDALTSFGQKRRHSAHTQAARHRKL